MNFKTYKDFTKEEKYLIDAIYWKAKQLDIIIKNIKEEYEFHDFEYIKDIAMDISCLFLWRNDAVIWSKINNIFITYYNTPDYLSLLLDDYFLYFLSLGEEK